MQTKNIWLCIPIKSGFLEAVLSLGLGIWDLGLVRQSTDSVHFGGGTLSAQTPGEWTWMHGNSAPNSSGVYGTQGVANPANKPRALYEPCEWRDKKGNFWLLGGGGVYTALWKYDPNPASPTYNQWTWMKCPSAANQVGVYGTQGISSPGNYPGSRGNGVITWVDTSGNLWLFGGYGYGAAGGLGSLNDLWKYDPNPASPTYNQWTWVKGPNTVNDPGSYGTMGVSIPANFPPPRGLKHPAHGLTAEEIYGFLAGRVIPWQADSMTCGSTISLPINGHG